MDYWRFVQLTHHDSWEDFQRRTTHHRRILLDVHAPTLYYRFTFQPNDIIIVGRESDGFSTAVTNSSPYRISIPMQEDTRSLNVASALSMALGEALRQTRWSQP